MRINANIHDVVEQGRNLCKIPGTCPWWRSEAETYLVEAGYTLAMLCHAAGTQNEQGNNCVGWALGISTTSRSNVTSCSNDNPNITTFLFGCVPRVICHPFWKNIIIWFSCHSIRKWHFPSCNSWLEKHLDEPAQFKTRLQSGQLVN
jgi:hypothetical protein